MLATTACVYHGYNSILDTSSLYPMTPQVRIDVDPDASSESILVYSILLNIPLNIPINYHPMALLPLIASIADLFTRPLPTSTHHRHTQLVS